MNAPRTLPPTAPELGSFPLDHEGACKSKMTRYLLCMQQQKDMHHLCKDLSKEYLECRMEHGLMARDDLTRMGFDPSIKVVLPEKEERSEEPKEVIAGLAAASRKKGTIFGW